MIVTLRILALFCLLFSHNTQAQIPPSTGMSSVTQYNHDSSVFPLQGKHKTAKCASCHQSSQYDDKPATECIACHARNQKHSGRFSRQCGDCHSSMQWKDIRFDHNKTAFPLVDRHANASCFSCHRDGPFRVRSACLSCHQKDDKHKGEQGSACSNCHNQKNWKEAKFDHDAKTNYPLIGKHMDAPCSGCHLNKKERVRVPTACADCHQKRDIHKGELGRNCESCHTEAGWKNSLFDHTRQTGVSLPGKHQNAPCLGCHRGGKYDVKTPTLCVYCHAGDDYHQRQFGALCANCHTENGWKDIKFDHSKQPFVLKGKHLQVKCTSCHQGRLYVVKPPNTCITCHQKADKHKGQLGRKCDSCHGEQGWEDSILK